jgi:small subunit ribosomal protein S2
MEIDIKELMEAGAHIGHRKSKRNPAMMPYIFEDREGISLIDLNATAAAIASASAHLSEIAARGKKILIIGTKEQAGKGVSDAAERLGMPYVTERWTGGMLTNFETTRKSVRKMEDIRKMMGLPEWESISKRERLAKERQLEKLKKTFGSIAEMKRLPGAVIIVDIGRESIAAREAKKLGIPVFGIVDTDSDPGGADFPIPANDDSTESVSLILKILGDAILEKRENTKPKERENEEIH